MQGAAPTKHKHAHRCSHCPTSLLAFFYSTGGSHSRASCASILCLPSVTEMGESHATGDWGPVGLLSKGAGEEAQSPSVGVPLCLFLKADFPAWWWKGSGSFQSHVLPALWREQISYSASFQPGEETEPGSAVGRQPLGDLPLETQALRDSSLTRDSSTLLP